jgi:hypothetical protein
VAYRALRRWLPRLFGAYLVAGFLAVSAPGFEVFPFFCWFLFPVAPNTVERYALVVEAWGGMPVTPPTTFQALDVVEDPHAMDAWTSIQALGRAVEAGDADRVARLRRRLEMNYLPAPSRYRLVRRTFDPLERWRTGRIRSEQILQTFASDEGCAEVPWARNAGPSAGRSTPKAAKPHRVRPPS